MYILDDNFVYKVLDFGVVLSNFGVVAACFG